MGQSKQSMSKGSSDHFTELNPGDVIYINKTGKTKPERSEPINIEHPKVSTDSEPPKPRVKLPSFAIPPADVRRVNNKDVRLNPRREIRNSLPASSSLQKSSPVAPSRIVDPILSPKPPQKPITNQPAQATPTTIHSQNSPQSPQLPLQHLRAETNVPKAEPFPNTALPIRPEPPQQALSANIPNPIAATKQLSTNSQQSVDARILIPPASPSDAQGVLKAPMATTDLQGTLLSTPPVVAYPPAMPVFPTPATDPENIQEEVQVEETEASWPERRRGTKRLKIFGIITILIILGTLVAGVLFAWPKIQVFLESKQGSAAHSFENVLVHLLQVKNQEIEIKIVDSQLENIVPDLGSQDAVSTVGVSVNNILKIGHSSNFSDAEIDSKFRFDLDLQTQGERDNLTLDVAAIFMPDGRAYFKLESLSINDRPVQLEETSFAHRWSDLGDLLRAQAGDEGTPLRENESIFLGYIANLLSTYSYPHYIVFLPAFNITQSQQHNQVQEALSRSRAYDLDDDSCKDVNETELRCNVRINYEELYSLYEDIYGILGKDMPAYYDILRITDNKNYNLPTNVVLVFDKKRNYPILLSLPDSSDEISASSWTINYKNFDDPSFTIRDVSDPLDLTEYHERIFKYEKEANFSI